MITCINIYIPLCFYFICGRKKSQRWPSRIYIPLCFYFIDWSSVRSKNYGLIYIPLCFYFICIHRVIFRQKILIYIPLCFYFILCIHAGHWRFFNLHSTMLLLYRSVWDIGWLYKRIYIPLCFYFIFPMISPCDCNAFIYIPLCFYFIRIQMASEMSLHH